MKENVIDEVKRIEEEAERIISEAKMTAQKIVEEATREKEKLIEKFKTELKRYYEENIKKAEAEIENLRREIERETDLTIKEIANIEATKKEAVLNLIQKKIKEIWQ